MVDVKEEFEANTRAELTDSDIERARLLIGVNLASKLQEHISTATYDSIRNFALGVGDDNPLFIDEHYGATTRWGAQVAPNSMSQIIQAPMLGDPMPEDVKRSTKGLFRGVHVYVSGGTTDWYRPIYPGDRLFCYNGEETLEVKNSEFAGRSVIQVRRDVKVNQRGEVVSVHRILRVLTERKTAKDRGKYSSIEPANYSDEDIEKIDAIYASEQRRGANKRYWEDVTVGESLPAMAKGPLTVTDIIAFHAGGYGFIPYGLKSGRLAYRNRKRIGAFYIKNELGVPDVAQRLHWDSEWAKAIGNPMAYDYGVMRETWFHHYLTDWAGDDAFVTRQQDSMRKFNYHGDVQFLSGEVVGKRERDGLFVVDVKMKMSNQRGVETSYAEATIALPSRDHGATLLPEVPDDIARTSTQMWERHIELTDANRRSAKA
ncbi:acyl dehydratase [Mycobacterium malmoense]|uniref:FAS1-like dehydratase domain-containing protein n=1 Tax=Mycobacterium malmoense TaxID=1780 RepID=UPI00080B8F47|nr:MaoC family dehydratase N-terminal domain-containing protein [Mycobacterium malmoense]OCB27466.1 acyl dehydratase [Mycobacterium malmoense]